MGVSIDDMRQRASNSGRTAIWNAVNEIVESESGHAIRIAPEHGGGWYGGDWRDGRCGIWPSLRPC